MMQHLHDNRVIHRDFKPLNIFLDDNYDICIADFGLSRKVEENIYLTMADLGSPLYMAPELFTDTYETYTNQIDVFSFGSSYMQYFILPVSLNDGKGRIKSHQNLKYRIGRGARFVQPENMNDDQYDIYTRCTFEDPNRRPSFRELCNAFEKNELFWFPGTNKAEYLKYIADC